MHTFRCRELLIFDSLQLSPSFIRPSKKPGLFQWFGPPRFWAVLGCSLGLGRSGQGMHVTVAANLK